MKLLMAMEGNTLHSIVADRFESAAWYLIIDDHLICTAKMENLGPRTREGAIGLALKEGATAVLSGALGLRTYNLLRSSNTKIAFAARISAQEALKRLKKGSLTVIEPAAFQQAVCERIAIRKERQKIFLKKETRRSIKRRPRA
jgi:predicted Fe-Mo cluster-binding NifX family protein